MQMIIAIGWLSDHVLSLSFSPTWKRCINDLLRKGEIKKRKLNNRIEIALLEKLLIYKPEMANQLPIV